MSPPSTRWQYVYAIISTDDLAVFDVDGLDPDEAVHTVVEGDLAVVVSEIDPACLRGLDRAAAVRCLSAHQRVVETVMRDYPALPVKFGTALPDEGLLRGLLRQGEGLLRATLTAYAGRQQREVVVLWDLQGVFQEIAAESPIATLRAQIAAGAPDETADARVALGQLVHAALLRRRAAIAEQVLPQLRAVAEDLIVNPTMDDSMVVNAALLIDDARQAELDEVLDALDTLFGGRLQIRCVGPLPPYSFATLEVRSLPFAAVDAARRQLGLADAVSSGEIKRAYRQIAAQAHPDLRPSDVRAGAEMEALNSAYQLLSALARAQAPALSEGGSDWPCRLDCAAVESTLLLNIARQELGA